MCINILLQRTARLEIVVGNASELQRTHQLDHDYESWLAVVSIYIFSVFLFVVQYMRHLGRVNWAIFIELKRGYPC